MMHDGRVRVQATSPLDPWTAIKLPTDSPRSLDCDNIFTHVTLQNPAPCGMAHVLYTLSV